MIQDMLDPEFYLAAYEVESESQRSLRPGMFQDVAPCNVSQPFQTSGDR
jgi:hypothetical protein